MIPQFMSFRFCLSCAVLLVGVIHLNAADWPAFRGPSGNGFTDETHFPSEWSPKKNVLWRVPLPGSGNSSPIVVGDRLFLTCADAEGKERSLYCFNRIDGRELWKQTVRFDFLEATHKTNPYCPSTPVSDGKSVFVWHGSAGMHSYSLDGAELWSRNVGRFSHVWGFGASPIVVDDLVIQLCGPGERTFIAAFDCRTGADRWQTPNEPGGSESKNGRYVGTWATPLHVKIAGHDQLVCCFHSRVVGLDPTKGKELWSIDGLSSDRSDLAYAMPMQSDRHIVVMGGYGGPEFGFQLNTQPTATITDRLWRNAKSEKNGYHPQRIGTGIVIGSNLFMANADEAGSIECLDTATGIRHWVEKRTNDGPHWGSMVCSDGLLFIPGQKGVTRVIKANPNKYKLVAVNDLGEQCNATPAFSNGEIYIRTFEALYAIGIR